MRGWREGDGGEGKGGTCPTSEHSHMIHDHFCIVPITLPPNTQVTQEITTTSDVTTALKDTKVSEYLGGLRGLRGLGGLWSGGAS